MSFSGAIARTWRENQLFSVLLELTYRCNLDCFFCYNDLGARGEALSTTRYLELLAELRELEVMNLIFSGGEPLAHPEFLRLGGAARELGFVVRLKSNGHALRGTLLRRVRDEVDPFMIEVSLHGGTAAVHDRQTRVPGSFDRLLSNLGEMRALDLRVKLNSTLTAWNEGEMEAMYAIADGLGVRLQFDVEVSPRDDGDREPLAISASDAGVRRLFALDIERRRAAFAAIPGTGPETAVPAPLPTPTIDGELPSPTGGKHCGAGSSTVAVDPYGNVYPCVQWRKPVGNLHRQTMREIWTSSRGLAEVRETTVAVGEMVAAAPAGKLMAFCPGSAAVNTGSPLQVYAAADRRRELLGEVLAADAERRTLLPILR